MNYKYGLSISLFALMLIFSSATVNNSNAVNTVNRQTETIFSPPAVNVITFITDHAEIPGGIADMVQQPVTQKDGKIFTIVDREPEFRGGMKAFSDFLAKNMRYPAVDRKNGIEGKVYVRFVVEKDGSLSSIKALRGPSETLRQEAVRVLASSPKWKPGYQHGKPVRVMYTLPVNFTLNNKMGFNKSPGQSLAAPGKNKVINLVEKERQFRAGADKANLQAGISDTIKHRPVVTVIEKRRNLTGNNDIDINGLISNTPAPLFVIDGVVKDKVAFDHLQPSDIKSFSVLKDASANIYGMEAAHGVILVTTRSAEKD